MQELYDKTFILSGERLGRIMVQSVQDQGRNWDILGRVFCL